MNKRTAQSHGRPRRSALRLLLLRGLLRLFARLPLRLSHAIGAGIGWLAWITHSSMRKTAADNIRRCLPELSTEQQDQLVRETLLETGKTLTELGVIWQGSREQIETLAREVRNEEILIQAMAADRGVILLAPHSGAWELGGLFTATRTQMTTLYRPPREPAFEALMNRSRERFGGRLVPANRHGVKALLMALRRGELVAILPDQEPNVGEGAFAPFFGHPAYTLTLVHNLMQKTGAIAILGRTERLPHGQGYRLGYFEAPIGMYDPDPAIALAALNQGIEQMVRENPAQYQWVYRRFGRQPTPSGNATSETVD
ncbi:lysophospholipid acyltransferase family protein [Halothiobacillus sp.]|uniref:lysophospholipid acyltransferase family protein n=1 Tax=Halothiobacillus sp. TaxID=1891311 RepID=UPI003D0D6755